LTFDGINRRESGSACATSFAGNSANRDTSPTTYASAWDYSTAGTITSVDDLLASPTTSRVYAYDAANPAAVHTITNPDIPAIPAVPAVPPSEENPEGVAEIPAVPAVPVAADTFTYDALGRMIGRVTHEVNTSTRTVATHTLTLTWDASSNLVKTDLDGAQVVYVYDSSGQRVAQLGVTASTATAYLGATEVTDPNTAAISMNDLKGTRYYTLGGATVAVREASATTTASSLSFLFGDVQGSAQVMVTHTVDPVTGALDAITANSVHANAYTPYGTTRGEESSAANDNLPIDHGWLGQVSDEASTGLVYLNARYYDPAVERFLSPDPKMNPSDPKTLDPYRYAENNPITYTDAGGLGPVCTGLSGTALDNCNAYGNNTANYITGKVKLSVIEERRRADRVKQIWRLRNPGGWMPSFAKLNSMDRASYIGQYLSAKYDGVDPQVSVDQMSGGTVALCFFIDAGCNSTSGERYPDFLAFSDSSHYVNLLRQSSKFNTGISASLWDQFGSHGPGNTAMAPGDQWSWSHSRSSEQSTGPTADFLWAISHRPDDPETAMNALGSFNADLTIQSVSSDGRTAVVGVEIYQRMDVASASRVIRSDAYTPEGQQRDAAWNRLAGGEGPAFHNFDMFFAFSMTVGLDP